MFTQVIYKFVIQPHTAYGMDVVDAFSLLLEFCFRIWLKHANENILQIALIKLSQSPHIYRVYHHRKKLLAQFYFCLHKQQKFWPYLIFDIHINIHSVVFYFVTQVKYTLT